MKLNYKFFWGVPSPLLIHQRTTSQWITNCWTNQPCDLIAENVGSNNIMGGGEKMSVRRMVSLIRQIGSDSDTTEMDTQRRLQRMLEETLTKNMHLQVSGWSIVAIEVGRRLTFSFVGSFFFFQEDVERLSQEIVRLSQIVGSANLN